MRALSAVEARVLAVLVEKQATVPDTYPLSLNTLVAGCNQKTARDPVMSVGEADALAALQGLRELALVNEVSGARVLRYEHNAARGLALPGAAVALLATLVLRGPQTAAELRANSERLHRFADVSSVEAFLDELAAKAPPRVLKLPRAPGEREARWAQLLCGEVDVSARPQMAAEQSARLDEIDLLKAEQARMDGELQRLRAQFAQLAEALGVDLH